MSSYDDEAEVDLETAQRLLREDKVAEGIVSNMVTSGIEYESPEYWEHLQAVASDHQMRPADLDLAVLAALWRHGEISLTEYLYLDPDYDLTERMHAKARAAWLKAPPSA